MGDVSALSSEAREAVGGRGSDVTLLSNAWDDQAPECPARLAVNPSWRHPRYQTEHRVQPATDPAGSCCTQKARWVVDERVHAAVTASAARSGRLAKTILSASPMCLAPRCGPPRCGRHAVPTSRPLFRAVQLLAARVGAMLTRLIRRYQWMRPHRRISTLWPAFGQALRCGQRRCGNYNGRSVMPTPSVWAWHPVA